MASNQHQARLLKQLASRPFEPMALVPGAAEAFREATSNPTLKAIREGWNNNLYAVWVSDVETEWGQVAHLWIRRHDSQPVRSWSDVQRIKREVLWSGRHRVGVEVYPPDVEVVDQANMYHLWVLPLGFRLPFSLLPEGRS
jgi:hypothetical protein